MDHQPESAAEDVIETKEWILVYKPGLLELVKDRAKLQLRVIELEELLKDKE